MNRSLITTCLIAIVGLALAVSPSNKVSAQDDGPMLKSRQRAPLLIGLLLPAVQKVREAAARSDEERDGPTDLSGNPGRPRILVGMLIPAIQKVQSAIERPGSLISGEGRSAIGVVLILLLKTDLGMN